MQSDQIQQFVHRRRLDRLQIFCTTCEHSEFVHCDHEARLCLYSECGCSGFTEGAAA